MLVDLPFAARPLALPVAARLWRGQDYPSRAALALDMVTRAHQARDGRRVSVVADAAYHHPTSPPCPPGWSSPPGVKTTAALSAPAPPRTGKRGRPCKRGDRLGSLAQVAARAAFTPVTVTCYGRQATVHVATVACQWYGPWRDTPVLLVLVRTGASAGYYDLALATTDTAASAAHTVECYAARWSAKTMLQHTREVVGTGQPRSRTARAVARTVGFQLAAHTLTVCWYATCARPDHDCQRFVNLDPVRVREY